MRGIHWVLILLLLIPSLLNFLTPLYNFKGPTALGLPFFYWFQIVMLPISAVFYLAFTYLQKGSVEGHS